MKISSSIAFCLLILGISYAASEDAPAITKEYLENLKKRVSWEVVSYEDFVFKGWTEAELRNLLGVKIPEDDLVPLPEYTSDEPLPAGIDWRDSECIHNVRNQGSCGSCWTFGTTGMLSDRCCLHSGKDQGWVAPQELLSCDIRNDGCNGGWPAWALEYVLDNNGLVPESCFKYVATEAKCTKTCEDGKNWKASHICNCKGLKQCLGVENMKQCLKTGPMAVTFECCSSFFAYRSGIYKCDCESGPLHAVTAIGYATEPECYWIVRNSWGAVWGDKGYFKMSCKSCGMEGKYVNGNAICEKVGV